MLTSVKLFLESSYLSNLLFGLCQLLHNFIKVKRCICATVYTVQWHHVSASKHMTMKDTLGRLFNLDYRNTVVRTMCQTRNTAEKETAMEKGRLIRFLIMLFYFGECPHAAAYVSATVSFFYFIQSTTIIVLLYGKILGQCWPWLAFVRRCGVKIKTTFALFVVLTLLLLPSWGCPKGATVWFWGGLENFVGTDYLFLA